MKLPASDFDFEYPEELIASVPAEPRDASRLLVVRRSTGAWAHRNFRDLPEYLAPGDCVVLNRTKVFSCRLHGKKSTGASGLLLVKEQAGPLVRAGLGLPGGHEAEFEAGCMRPLRPPTPMGNELLLIDPTSWPTEKRLAAAAAYILKKKVAGRHA